jgi:hypothetical protein
MRNVRIGKVTNYMAVMIYRYCFTGGDIKPVYVPVVLGVFQIVAFLFFAEPCDFTIGVEF